MPNRIIIVMSALALAASPLQAAEERPVVELGAGLFQLTLDPAVGTDPPDFLGDVIEWEYVGQAIYAAPDATAGKRRRTAVSPPDAGPTTLLSRLLRTEMEDEHGRLFRPKKVDTQLLKLIIDDYDRMVEARFGPEPVSLDADEDAATDPAEPGVATPLSWSRSDQDGDGNNDLFLWNSDGRSLCSEPLTERMQKSVTYAVGDSGSDGTFCSGVLIGNRAVLTAAHCAKNSSGSAWVYSNGSGEAYRGKVCTEGNYYSGRDCANVTARWGNGDYTGDGDFADDLVILKIDEDLGASNYMPLSQASNSTLKSHDAYNLGYPGLTPGGSNNIFGLLCVFSSGDPVGGYESDAFAPCKSTQYWDNGDVNRTTTKKIGTKVDVSSGHSGGPIYYYPNGVSSSASHYLTGIMAGHHQGATKSWNGGPKIPYHRDWILGIIGGW